MDKGHLTLMHLLAQTLLLPTEGNKDLLHFRKIHLPPLVLLWESRQLEVAQTTAEKPKQLVNQTDISKSISYEARIWNTRYWYGMIWYWIRHFQKGDKIRRRYIQCFLYIIYIMDVNCRIQVFYDLTLRRGFKFARFGSIFLFLKKCYLAYPTCIRYDQICILHVSDTYPSTTELKRKD